jgi:hypothetical protein
MSGWRGICNPCHFFGKARIADLRQLGLKYISPLQVIKINYLHAKEHTETLKMGIIKNY